MHHQRRRRLLACALLATAVTAAGAAYASCGGAFCVLNTNWDMHEGAAPGQARVDLRYEYIKQDQLFSGGSKISAADVASDVAELKTVNRNTILSADYTFTTDWSAAVSIPWIDRRHSHIEDPTGAAQLENWDIARLGDVRLAGRYRLPGSGAAAGAAGLEFGLKLPTGGYRYTNAEGVTAERSLQPGTGSTDAVLGATYSWRPRFLGMGWFVQGTYQHAVATRDGFRPGDQLSATGGLRYPATDALSLLFQMNALYRRRDAGPNAEPDESGGRFLYTSPGFGYAVTRDAQLYGFVQKPVYRRVNGTQIVADRLFTGGVSVRF